MNNYTLIGVASGAGAQDNRCENGPDALLSAGMLAKLYAAGVTATWQQTLRPANKNTSVEVVTEICSRLAMAVAELMAIGQFPVIVGGDHSCAIGTWGGVNRAIARKGSLGLIWIDAHMDSHTPETSPSGALHGMPLACLLGYGLSELLEIAGNPPPLLPQNICLIGVRSFEAGEAALLKRLGVRIFFMDEVRQRGIASVMGEATAIVQRNTAGFGISIDMDVLDPSEDPGVGSPAPGGILGFELVSALKQLNNHAQLLGVEIVEYNPGRDRNQITAQRAIQLLLAVIGQQHAECFEQR